MKKLIVMMLLAVVSTSVFAQTEKGSSSFGLNLGYGFDTENVTLGIDYRYNLTNEIRLTPSITHFIKNDVKAWAIDMNAHYVVQLSDMFGFYPLGGVSFSFWKFHSIEKTRFGANIGLGGELYATKEVTIGLEARYNIIKDFDQALIAIRVGYNF